MGLWRGQGVEWEQVFKFESASRCMRSGDPGKEMGSVTDGGVWMVGKGLLKRTVSIADPGYQTTPNSASHSSLRG